MQRFILSCHPHTHKFTILWLMHSNFNSAHALNTDVLLTLTEPRPLSYMSRPRYPHIRPWRVTLSRLSLDLKLLPHLPLWPDTWYSIHREITNNAKSGASSVNHGDTNSDSECRESNFWQSRQGSLQKANLWHTRNDPLTHTHPVKVSFNGPLKLSHWNA
jgi:hypothetical protein